MCSICVPISLKNLSTMQNMAGTESMYECKATGKYSVRNGTILATIRIGFI